MTPIGWRTFFKTCLGSGYLRHGVPCTPPAPPGPTRPAGQDAIVLLVSYMPLAFKSASVSGRVLAHRRASQGLKRGVEDSSPVLLNRSRLAEPVRRQRPSTPPAAAQVTPRRRAEPRAVDASMTHTATAIPAAGQPAGADDERRCRDARGRPRRGHHAARDELEALVAEERCYSAASVGALEAAAGVFEDL